MVSFPNSLGFAKTTVIQTARPDVKAAVVSAIIAATATLAADSFVDAFTVAPDVVTFGLFLRGVHAASLIVGGTDIGMAWYFVVL